jgi:hypothetical protein
VLYTRPGDESYDMLQAEPDLFLQYHQGFREQTRGWPKQPVDLVISWLAGRPDSLLVADFGCGDAKIAASVKQVRAVQQRLAADRVQQRPAGRGSVLTNSMPAAQQQHANSMPTGTAAARQQHGSSTAASCRQHGNSTATACRQHGSSTPTAC